MTAWDLIAARIGEARGSPFRPAPPRALGGGSIHQAAVLDDGRQRFFVKRNAAHWLAMFEAESAGLAAMEATRTLRVPTSLCTGLAGDEAFLVLEYLELGGPSRGSEERAGRQLAALHRTTAPAFGWERDNTIGATPQDNTWERDWARFWHDRRLGFQLDLAARQGHGGRLQERGRRLLEEGGALLDHGPPPALLHGDLWGGNLGYDPAGQPVVYDPAVYFGDREADLAMTELFGGFGPAFQAAYREAWPVDPGYTVRRECYNLYHVLNHLNLFGTGYLGRAQHLIDRLLAELR